MRVDEPEGASGASGASGGSRGRGQLPFVTNDSDAARRVSSESLPPRESLSLSRGSLFRRGARRVSAPPPETERDASFGSGCGAGGAARRFMPRLMRAFRRSSSERARGGGRRRRRRGRHHRGDDGAEPQGGGGRHHRGDDGAEPQGEGGEVRAPRGERHRGELTELSESQTYERVQETGLQETGYTFVRTTAWFRSLQAAKVGERRGGGARCYRRQRATFSSYDTVEPKVFIGYRYHHSLHVII